MIEAVGVAGVAAWSPAMRPMVAAIMEKKMAYDFVALMICLIVEPFFVQYNIHDVCALF